MNTKLVFKNIKHLLLHIILIVYYAKWLLIGHNGCDSHMATCWRKQIWSCRLEHGQVPHELLAQQSHLQGGLDGT